MPDDGAPTMFERLPGVFEPASLAAPKEPSSPTSIEDCQAGGNRGADLISRGSLLGLLWTPRLLLSLKEKIASFLFSPLRPNARYHPAERPINRLLRGPYQSDHPIISLPK